MDLDGTQPHPWTRELVAGDLQHLGVTAGMTLLVHSSLRSMGWVCGAATTVVHALRDAVGPEGTIVVPSHTSGNRDPSRWVDPRLPEAWWPTIRAHLPAFDPQITPSMGVGVIAEQVRTWPGALRSGHPQTSFAAVGARATAIVTGHDLVSQLGEASPLARLEAEAARVLLLGVGFDRCTAFHLAEYRQPAVRMVENSCAVMTPHGRRWVVYQAVALDQSDFAALGRDFEAETRCVTVGQVGRAECRLFPVRAAVGFAQQWFQIHRSAPNNQKSPPSPPKDPSPR